MPALAIQPWIEVVSLHPDGLTENFSEVIFAWIWGHWRMK